MRATTRGSTVIVAAAGLLASGRGASAQKADADVDVVILGGRAMDCDAVRDDADAVELYDGFGAGGWNGD